MRAVSKGQEIDLSTPWGQEADGNTYWLLRADALGKPESVWVLPSHNTRVLPGGAGYEVRDANGTARYSMADVIHFKYPDPRDPYGPGLSPLKATFENAAQASQYTAFRAAPWDNAALPSAVVSPKEQVSPEERDRMEAEWNAKFRRGGNGKVLVAESAVEVTVLRSNLADLADLAAAGATRDDIANAFGVRCPT
jgi:phage portal protein BeeE